MNNQLLHCLHQSKVLLMLAEKGDWEKFESLNPVWAKEVDTCLASSNSDTRGSETETSIKSLIEDVDQIQILIKAQMSKVEKDIIANRHLNKAVNSYLK